jgi:hypothetical protein
MSFFNAWGTEGPSWASHDPEEEIKEDLLDPFDLDLDDLKTVKALQINPKPEMLYAYMLDSNFMEFKDPKMVMDLFSNVHGSFVSILDLWNNTSTFPPAYFMKAYFKYRHNAFSTLFKICVFGHSHIFDTDMPLSSFIESDKTPDHIHETENKITLLEFTVGNDYERIDFLKGGGTEAVKYSSEAREISEKTGKICIPLIIPAVIKAYNIEEIREIASSYFNSDVDKDFLQLFFDICSKNLDLIGENTTIASSFIPTELELPIFKDMESFERPQLGKILSLSPEFICSFYENLKDLRYSCVRFMEKSHRFKVSLCYNMESTKFYIRHFETSKLVPRELYNSLNSGNLGNIILMVDVMKGDKHMSLSAVKGTMPLMVNNFFENKRQVKTFTYKDTVDSFYFSTVSAYQDNYNTPRFFNSSDLKMSKYWGDVSFDSTYYNDLLAVSTQQMKTNDVKKKMLASNSMNMTQLKAAISGFEDNMSELNAVPSSFYPKQSFQFPLVSMPTNNTNFENINAEMISTYLKHSDHIYTKAILLKVKENKFSSITTGEIGTEIRQLRNELSLKNRMYYDQVIERKLTGVKYHAMDKANKKELKSYKDEISQAQKRYMQSLSSMTKSVRDRMVKIICKKRSMLNNHWKEEMKHFQKKGSQYRGVGELSQSDHTKCKDYFQSLADRFFSKEFTNLSTRKIYNDLRGPGPDFLTNEKNKFTADWDIFYKNLSGTLFDQETHFVSSLCHCLFKESTRTYNNNYIKIDNLGLKDIIVLIRGGSKIYKNQTSKLFKVFFKIDPLDVKYTGYQDNPSFEVIKCSSFYMVVTPWMQLHQDVLLDGISFRHRAFMNLYTNQKRSLFPLDASISRFNSLSIFLFLHNRRKTESFMHNCRYLIVNVLGRFANLQSIIKSFASFNYTYFDAWLKNCISTNYLGFAEKFMTFKTSNRSNVDSSINLIDLRDLWFDEPLNNSDHLTSFIYSTYMMTKAPVVSSIEQAGNLWEIIEDVHLFESTHPKVEGLDDASLRFDCRKFNASVYDDDFKYDPVFCQFLGHYTASYLNRSLGRRAIQAKWLSILNQPIDVIANSKGLRGWKKDNFFNKKSYEIVYEKIIEMMESEDVDINTLVDQYMKSPNLNSSSFMVSSDKQTFSNTETTLNDLVFHIVQKIQRGGSREIFCMDMETKIKQNPLEKFFKFLCKSMPNEFISVPSNRRPGMIHTDFFEKGPGSWVKQIVRWVLDCRRWAPHSVFQKYVHFIHGMAPLLPIDFLNRFYRFSDQMFKKRFYTREHVLSKMRNNVRFDKYKSMFIKDEKSSDGYYFHVKFSFVMGIFNYLSSLMHAGNQFLASELIRDHCLLNGLGLVHMETKCHSDDSVVSSHHEKEESIEPSVYLYDWWLKSANHMLSVKKSQVNDNVYLEFLSTLYLFDRLLPVLPKFSSSLPFQPSDSGYSADITFSVTQAIEMLSQGGSFEESFLMLKLTENFVQGLYNLNSNLSIPFHFLGGIDAHPIELLLSGSDCEIFKHLRYNRSHTMKIVKLLSKSKIINLKDIGSFSLNWDMGSRSNPRIYKKFSKIRDTLSPLLEIGSWTLENSKLGNPYLNTLWFINKLSDPKYYSSMMSEPSARRYNRIFGAFSHRNIRNVMGELVSVNEISDRILAVEPNLGEVDEVPTMAFEKVFEVIHEELNDFYDCLSDVEISEVLPNNLKDKPITFVSKDPFLGSQNLNPSEYVILKKEPEMLKLLGKFKDYSRDAAKIDDRILTMGINPSELDENDLFKLSSKILGKDNRVYKITACVASENRFIDRYSQMLNLLETNSQRHVRYVFKFKRANMIDWEKRLMKGRIPHKVSECMKHFWASKCLERFEMQNEDIYKIHPSKAFDNSLKEIPREWALIVLSAHKTDASRLIDKFYWSYWPSEQIKVGKYWYGKGNCIINIPETLMEIVVTNGIVTNLLVDRIQNSTFSVPSSWYLKSLFNQNGMLLEMVLSEYCEPDTKVIGYVRDSGLYGYGFPSNFDYVFINTIEGGNISFNFMHQTIEPYPERNHWIYKERYNKHKIYFFTPEDDDIMVSLSDYIDKEKVKARIFEPNIKAFCSQFAIDYGLKHSYDLVSLMDNISRSKMYKVLHNYEHSRVVYEDKYCKESDALFEALIQWKSVNPDFGFPDLDTLCRLLKQYDVPPLPYSIQKMLFNMGKNDLDDTAVSDIIFKAVNLSGDDRDQYLRNISIQYGGELSVDMVSIAMKTKRIFNVCNHLGKESMRIISPVFQIIHGLLIDGKVHCSSLYYQSIELNSFLKSSSEGEYARTYNESDLFLFYASRAIADGMLISTRSSFSKSIAKIIDIIVEMLDNGLLNHFALAANSNPLLASVDFSIEDVDFSNWIIDLFDSLTSFGWRLPKGQVLRDQTFIGENGKLSVELSYFRACLIKIHLTPHEPSITVKVSKKKNNVSVEEEMTLKLCRNVQCGVVFQPFRPMDEESAEEYEDGFRFDPDIEEVAVFDDSIILPPFAYVYQNQFNLIALKGCRGTAHNLIVRCATVSMDIMKSSNNIKIYRKTTYKDCYELINNISDIIVLVSKSKYTHLQIENYSELNYPSMMRFFTPSKHVNEDMVVNGIKTTKTEMVKNPELVYYVSTLENYFGKISKENSKEALKRIKKVESIQRDTGILLSESFETVKKQLDIEIEEFRKREREKKPIEEGEINIDVVSKDDEEKEEKTENVEQEIDSLTPSNNLLEMLSKISLSDISDSKSSKMNLNNKNDTIERKIMNAKPSNMKFKDPVLVLTDIEFKAEFETYFPGYWDLIVNKEKIALTARTKKKRIQMAELCIRSMPQYMKEKYQRLLMIVKFVLTTIPETNNKNTEDLRFSDLIEDLFYIEEEYSSEDEIPFQLMEPDSTRVEIQLNIENIF